MTIDFGFVNRLTADYNIAINIRCKIDKIRDIASRVLYN